MLAGKAMTPTQDKQQQLVERVILAISEHHSGNADEAKLIAKAAISILQPELQKRDEVIGRLTEVAHEAVDYVGSANYADRVARAHDKIDAALTATDTMGGGK